jgi:predicted nucleic acid-binding protein
MGPDVLSPARALTIWDTLSSDERFQEVESVPASHEAVFRSLVRGREPSPNLWTDAWLAALSETSERQMVTFDQGFRAFGISSLQVLHV